MYYRLSFEFEVGLGHTLAQRNDAVDRLLELGFIESTGIVSCGERAGDGWPLRSIAAGGEDDVHTGLGGEHGTVRVRAECLESASLDGVRDGDAGKAEAATKLLLQDGP